MNKTQLLTLIKKNPQWSKQQVINSLSKLEGIGKIDLKYISIGDIFLNSGLKHYCLVLKKHNDKSHLCTMLSSQNLDNITLCELNSKTISGFITKVLIVADNDAIISNYHSTIHNLKVRSILKQTLKEFKL